MVTIHDVAKAAGVSISTVSYSMSGRRPVAEATRLRIAEVIRELGFEPNAGARMLAGARTGILALSAPVRPDSHLPTHMRFVSAISVAARRSDYDVLLLAGGDEVHGIRRVTARGLVDGVVLYGVASDDDRVATLRAQRTAASFIGVPDDHEGFACVDLDFEATARDVVRRLAGAGHRTVGVIGHPYSYLDRHTGFIQRFADAFDAEAASLGLVTAARYPRIGREAAVAALDELRAALPGMTALVLHCNEPVVEAVLRSLLERGVRIPEDLSVVAAAASYDTERLEVPLSVIPLPLEQMCERAVTAAVARIEGDGERGVTLLPPEYRDRGSVAAR